jgi:antirestriction protein ArdC
MPLPKSIETSPRADVYSRVTAAAHAQRAADYLHGLQQPAEATGAAA